MPAGKSDGEGQASLTVEQVRKAPPSFTSRSTKWEFPESLSWVGRLVQLLVDSPISCFSPPSFGLCTVHLAACDCETFEIREGESRRSYLSLTSLGHLSSLKAVPAKIINQARTKVHDQCPNLHMHVQLQVCEPQARQTIPSGSTNEPSAT